MRKSEAIVTAVAVILLGVAAVFHSHQLAAIQAENRDHAERLDRVEAVAGATARLLLRVLRPDSPPPVPAPRNVI